MRQLQGFERSFVNLTAAGFALFFVYATAVTLPFYVTRPIYICLCYILVFSLYPASATSPRSRISAVDVFLGALTLVMTVFFFMEYEYYIEKPGLMRPKDMVMGTVALVLSIEACRRVLGLSLPILSVAGLAYVLWGFVIPGALGHRGFTYARAIGQIFSFDGIYGSITGVYATYVMLFVIFGAVIQACGMSAFLLELSNTLVGRLKGGAAKTAVVSSGAVGMIMGSGAANVAVTGSFTIPVMKKVGYPAHVAGAIETVASAGGVLMPPIMGSAAFVLASFTEIPYGKVALYSFLPALLFYWGIYIQVHFLSHKLGIPEVRDAAPMAEVMRKGWHMLIPIALVFILIFGGLSPYRAALWAIAATILLHFIRPYGTDRMNLTETFLTFGDGAKLQLSVGASAGAIGVIVSMLVLPGLPLKVASFAVMLSQGNLLAMLFLMIITSYVFGMGIPMIAAYIILAVIAVPGLVELGLPLFNAHLIIMWYSLAALWTPPVAVGAFVASGIAGASASRIGWYAVRLGIGLYVIPVLMAYGTIINGTLTEILFAGLAIACSLYAFAAAAEGHTHRPLQPWERAFCVVLAALLIFPATGIRLVGMAFFVLAVGFEWRIRLAQRPSLEVKSS
ncbi:MAG: TRAP transporter fused permease subunit [Candidatus Tectomicrobia bacterium]|uniref:TRAP transporter fused permease subunit n=1 Tax=Tectimicrobiota bacterium TaxID=2528274 RepID=A0A932HZ37_UNCTE|nr:TRAP transporter fused permease subunit [Candidatus Tectomicrobia bacterium]